MTIQERILRTQNLLGLAQENAQSQEEKDFLATAVDALWFIWRNGQMYEFEEYRRDQDADAPLRVIAAFDTEDEAHAWLKAQPRVPLLAKVLIADQYHVVMCSDDQQKRYLPPDLTIAYYIQELTRDGSPPATARFDTLEEARAWFNAQCAPLPWTVIQVGGAHYLAVHYRNIHHRALFPFSIVERLEKLTPSEP
ncbi:head protein [Melittangium boletus]|uniref:Head protein n=1 Tax=Melittangium boletus DSM 14713 TaxID=1294270 RepID=A0A250IFP1_9BACT|nr:head protein [Melittangium boletus]ATB30053.1 hypothetical protein MEBOL_003508 [Melittangium boletus DSM 14713]